MDGFISKTPLALARASSFYYESSNPTSKSIFPRLEGLVLNRRTPKTSNDFSISDWLFFLIKCKFIIIYFYYNKQLHFLINLRSFFNFEYYVNCRIESFDHLFSTWINNQRNLFYVCTYSFTILFTRSLKNNLKSDETNFNSENPRQSTLKDNIISPIFLKSSINNNSENSKSTENIENATHKIVVTPTTLGFREMLNAQGFFFIIY